MRLLAYCLTIDVAVRVATFVCDAPPLCESTFDSQQSLTEFICKNLYTWLLQNVVVR